MVNLNENLNKSFASRYAELGSVVKEMAQSLDEEQFWRKPFTFGNSFGHLVLHLTGNLNYYIGAEIGKTGYVRDRPREFTETERRPKKDVMQRFDDAVKMVVKTIQEQKEEDWAKPYSAKGEEDAGNRWLLVLRCATHLHHHVGQMMYLKNQLATEKPAKSMAD